MRILYVRLDHIGDMLLSTPLLAALHHAFPAAQLDVLTNEYAAPVLAGNRDVARVYTYRKWHHARGLGGKLAALGTQWSLLSELAATHYDVAVLGKPETDRRQRAMMRWVKATRIIVARGDDAVRTRGVTDLLDWRDAAGPHFVQQMMFLATPLGLCEGGGPLQLAIDPARRDTARATLAPLLARGRPLVAVNLSARKVKQRWPVEAFAALIRRLTDEADVSVAVFWAPGAADDPKHPGDDAKAAAVMQAVGERPCVAYRTTSIADLAAALSLTHAFITSDGGALHIGVACGLPTVALFGNSDAAMWGPWRVPHTVLQPPSKVVADLTVDEVYRAFVALTQKAGFRQDTALASDAA